MYGKLNCLCIHVTLLQMVKTDNDNDNDNDNECFILTYELIKQIIYSTMIDQYSHSQGNYIMTYISLACNYRKMF